MGDSGLRLEGLSKILADKEFFTGQLPFTNVASDSWHEESNSLLSEVWWWMKKQVLCASFSTLTSCPPKNNATKVSSRKHGRKN